jgi:hypothetical protein
MSRNALLTRTPHNQPQRGGQGESEEGFIYADNSCFPRFNSYSEFTAWLADARVYGGEQTVLSGANDMRVAISGVAAALMLAVAAVWA